MRSPSAAFLSLVLLGACGGAPPPPVQEPASQPAPVVEAPSSAEWAVAAKGAGEGKSAACAAVAAALKAEKACVGSLCAHAAALSKERSRYCGEDDAALAADLAARSQKPPSECGARAEAILDKGCSGDATCENTASRWAARCAKSDGSPLVFGLLGRSIAKRKALPDFTLDVRSCDELRAEVRRVVACDRATCPTALKTAQAYRGRCAVQGELPEAATALAEAAIFSSAGQVSGPTLVRPNPPKLTPADMPVLVPDRWGAYASVCGERPADMAAYVASRRACENGKIVIVRYFVNVSKEFEVRGGALDAPDDETFARRFPSLRAVGELEARDAAAKKALEIELPKVAALAKDPANAAHALVRLAREHGDAIARSAAVRAAFAAVDADLAPALAEIGKAKLAAAKSALAADLAGLAARAPSRPFADLNESGAVAIGAASPAVRIDGAALFPKAMEAYTTALGNLAALAKKKPLSMGDARDTKRNAVDAAKACALAARRAHGNEHDLVACAFTLNTCAPSKIDALKKYLDEDRAAMVSARHKIDLATTVLRGAARKEVEKAAVGCPSL